MPGLVHVAHRNLVRTPVILGPLAVDFLRAGPALRRTQHDHRPQRSLCTAVALRLRFDVLQIVDDAIECAGHELVHGLGIAALDEMRLVPITAEQVIELFVADARQYTRVGDLVAVQVQDRKHHAIGQRIQEFVGMPTRGERPRFRFAVADDAGHDQVRVVECGAERMRKGISQLATFVDRARSFWRHVTRDAPRERELLEQPLHALFVQRDVRIHLAIRAIEPRIRHQGWTAMTGTGDVDHVQITLVDDAIEMRVDEVQSRRGAPVTEQPRLDVFSQQGPGEQRVVVQINLPD